MAALPKPEATVLNFPQMDLPHEIRNRFFGKSSRRNKDLDEDGQTYYESFASWEIAEAFRNLDELENFVEFNRRVVNAKSRNFCVDFSDEEGWCGFDLDAESYGKLFKKQRPSALNTRWLNIWMPYEQRDLLTVLAKHYDFSPRLLTFMCSSPIRRSLTSTHTSKTSLASIFRRSQHGSNGKDSKESTKAPPSDPEKNQSPETSQQGSSLGPEDCAGLASLAGTPSELNLTQLNQYAIANEIWHYSTMDWGRSYVCLGYNTLHPSAASVAEGVDSVKKTNPHQDLPSGTRIWNWLILCDDKTVISISEDPFPGMGRPLTMVEQRSLGIIRRNLINVFRQCSKARDPTMDGALMQLPIRTRLGDSEEEERYRPSDAPGLLFYYLFDDWLTIYSLIARREHRYAAELDRLRVSMLSKAQLDHIDQLHHIGNQLGVLKRLYKGYDLIIDRLLDKREASLASLANSNVIQSSPESLDSSHHETNIAEQPHSSLGPPLSSAARVRFLMLKHRIQLYALSEVSDCLDQKDSLVTMNFNLIAIKESYSVEKLTRVTLLLGKVTILFMPVSLMSAYFSCQFTDQVFSVKEYWAWFGGILGASVVMLFAFSLASGTIEGKMAHKGISRRIVEMTAAMVAGKRKIKKAVMADEYAH